MPGLIGLCTTQVRSQVGGQSIRARVNRVMVAFVADHDSDQDYSGR